MALSKFDKELRILLLQYEQYAQEINRINDKLDIIEKKMKKLAKKHKKDLIYEGYKHSEWIKKRLGQ